MSIVQFLTEQVSDLNQDQAEGTAGMLFDLVKSKLGDQEFATLSTVIPESQELIDKAPASGGGGLMGTLGSLAGAIGGDKMGQLGQLASLAGGLQKLGVSPDLLTQIIPLVLQFVQSKGGDGMMEMVQKVLKP